MAGGKPHGHNPKTRHAANDAHKRLEHAEKQEERAWELHGLPAAGGDMLGTPPSHREATP